jgi:hypothetical protein
VGGTERCRTRCWLRTTVGHLVGDSEGEIVGCSTGCPVGVSVGLVVVGASETIFVGEAEGDGISVGGVGFALGKEL